MHLLAELGSDSLVILVVPEEHWSSESGRIPLHVGKSGAPSTETDEATKFPAISEKCAEADGGALADTGEDDVLVANDGGFLLDDCNQLPDGGLVVLFVLSFVRVLGGVHLKPLRVRRTEVCGGDQVGRWKYPLDMWEDLGKVAAG